MKLGEQKINAFERLQIWWRFNGRYFHKEFVRGVKNLWKWLPVIWKDRDWDDYYIWEVLIFKLKKQAKYIGDRDFHTRAKRDAEIMMTCVRLMEKIKNESYGMEYMDYCEDDFEFVPCDDKPDYSELKITPISENFNEYFAKRKTAYRYITKQYANFITDHKHIAMRMGQHQHNKARRILFTLMERNIEGWWD